MRLMRCRVPAARFTVAGVLMVGALLLQAGCHNEYGAMPQGHYLEHAPGFVPASAPFPMACELARMEEKGQAAKPKIQTWKRDRQRPTFARVYVGDGNSLELVSLQVTVTVEGPRARTVVDHIFRNPHDKQLEGTFEYPLPTGASPSYFAMFLGQTRDTLPVRFAGRGNTPAMPDTALASLTPAQLMKEVSTTDWGKLREARVVGKEKALETYEETVRAKIDPALLEYAGGNTFSGRVFPIPAKGYNRVVIAYEELLPTSQGKTFYRYPLPDCPLQDIQFTLQANAEECREVEFKPASAKKEEGGSQLFYTKTWKQKGPDGEVLFAFAPARADVQAIAGRQGDSGPVSLYARVRPDLAAAMAKPFARHAVFLLDCSLSEHPDRFAVSIMLLRKILETDADIGSFNILAFNVGTTWVNPAGWLPNTPAGREKAFAKLDGLVLEAATDLSAALARLAKPGFDIEPATPVNVFLLSDGQITWGDPDVATLVARFEERCPFPTRFHCYRTGLGADNLELFEGLTRRGGGIFNCYSTADLDAAACAHRHQCMQVTSVRFAGGPAVSEVLVAGRKAAVYPGGELIVGAHFDAPGKTKLIVEGTFQGQPVVREYPLEITPASGLAPRGWAELAVASLLSLNDPKLDALITAYCQQFGIGSRVASFLVLENDEDYKRLDLEAERGRTVPGNDVGRFVEKAWKELSRPLTLRESFGRFLKQVEPRVHLLEGDKGKQVKEMLALLADTDYELPEADLEGVLLCKRDVPPAYLAARGKDRRQAETYLTEASRRVAKQDAAGAVRALSSIVEEYPGRGDALRLVGYRLLDLNQPVQAVQLFNRVQRQRPFEPHSYLDMARSLEQCHKYAQAALHYEIVLAGTWDSRFHESLKTVAQESYVHMMREAIARKDIKGKLADHFGNRLESMDARQFQSDLRVSISWNTDATDVDLWVFEPDGTKCYYQNRQTPHGGELTNDVTQGYGPERFQARKAMKGEYVIKLHYFNANPNLLAGETHVNVVVTRHAGSPDEQVERRTIILKKSKDEVEVCRVKF